MSYCKIYVILADIPVLRKKNSTLRHTDKKKIVLRQTNEMKYHIVCLIFHRTNTTGPILLTLCTNVAYAPEECHRPIEV